jgi:hypothetical protein
MRDKRVRLSVVVTSLRIASENLGIRFFDLVTHHASRITFS